MKIYGPYTRKDGRLIVILYDFEKKIKQTVSYPKYLMEQHLGRKFEEWETVDHIDNNPANNDLSNLRILSRAENARRAIKPAKMEILNCKTCGEAFSRRKAVNDYERSRGKNVGYCSHSCAGQQNYQHKGTVVKLANTSGLNPDGSYLVGSSPTSPTTRNEI